MAVPRANWFTEALDAPVGQREFEIDEVGKPIELEGEFATLNERLVQLVNQEGFLFQQGVTCDIKDRDDTTCLACPVAGEEGTRLHALCSIGREQERTSTALAVLRLRDG